MRRTHIETTIHACQTFRVARAYPFINNAIAIEVTTETGAFELTMFGLPPEVTRELMATFGDKRATIHHMAEREEIASSPA